MALSTIHPLTREEKLPLTTVVSFNFITEQTPSVCPFNTRDVLLVKSHTRKVPSSLPLTIVVSFNFITEKTLSSCLSIQAHPNKSLAEKLHAERPLVYKDPNHKPEMTIAVTPFEAMCQFRPVGEIVNFAENVPEFSAVLGEKGIAATNRLKVAETEDQKRVDLKALFSEYSKADAELVAAQVANLVTRVNASLAEKFPTLLTQSQCF